jgi:hypothetical protein
MTGGAFGSVFAQLFDLGVMAARVRMYEEEHVREPGRGGR